ncbi:hypothetical protein BDZ45DRAFT_752086 [Acephala macrosclerotiorum]|nr:hypothetical protein BDZ45DRAFT_752086 [Acephala macrosclerotiorum]
MAFAHNRNNMTAVQQMFPTGGVQAYANSACPHARLESMLALDVDAKLGGFNMLEAMGGLHGAKLVGFGVLKAMGGLHGAKLAKFDMSMVKLGVQGLQLGDIDLPKAKLGLDSRVSLSCESADEDEELVDDDPYPVVGPSPNPKPDTNTPTPGNRQDSSSLPISAKLPLTKHFPFISTYLESGVAMWGIDGRLGRQAFF